MNTTRDATQRVENYKKDTERHAIGILLTYNLSPNLAVRGMCGDGSNAQRSNDGDEDDVDMLI